MDSIIVVKPGAANSIQDNGRFGYRRYGVPISGISDPYYASCANSLVGNPANAPLIEIPLMGPHLSFVCDPRTIALVGDIKGNLLRAGIKSPVEPWKAISIQREDILELSGTSGTSYLAIQGSFDIKPVMQSYATYERAKLGGLNGGWLRVGDAITLNPIETIIGYYSKTLFNHELGPISVIPGPQEFAFTQSSLYAFVTTEFTVSKQWDRMGIRLEGLTLSHLTPNHADMASDGICPGAIQVPGSGDPIILGIDSQTIGGYPKIATIITADLARLAHLRTGDRVSFKNVKIDEAVKRLKEKTAILDQWIAKLQSIC